VLRRKRFTTSKAESTLFFNNSPLAPQVFEDSSGKIMAGIAVSPLTFRYTYRLEKPERTRLGDYVCFCTQSIRKLFQELGVEGVIYVGPSGERGHDYSGLERRFDRIERTLED